MPDFKEIVGQLQELASTRGGKMILATLLTLGALLAAVRYMLWAGTLGTLEGGWEIAHNFAVLIFFIALALAIALILWPRPTPKQSEGVSAISASSSEKASKIIKGDRIGRWARRVFLVWTIIICVVVYAVGWTLILKDLVYPAIQQIAATQFNFSEFISSKSFINSVMAFVMVSFWAIMPVVFYLEIDRTRRSGKDAKDTRVRRQHK